ncbi:MAG: hypothetical protein U0V70_11585 [Terriglobia bacterium]
MRKIIGWMCYLVGAGLTVLALQIFVNCDVIRIFARSSNILTMPFWEFILQSSGQHQAYPNGYFVHLIRDIGLLGLGILIIIMGRENLVFKDFSLKKKVPMVVCPECRRKTYADAYCRFCGFNLVTLQPTAESPTPMAFWKVSLYSYLTVSVVLIVINLLMLNP